MGWVLPLVGRPKGVGANTMQPTAVEAQWGAGTQANAHPLEDYRPEAMSRPLVAEVPPIMEEQPSLGRRSAESCLVGGLPRGSPYDPLGPPSLKHPMANVR